MRGLLDSEEQFPFKQKGPDVSRPWLCDKHSTGGCIMVELLTAGHGHTSGGLVFIQSMLRRRALQAPVLFSLLA